MPKAYKLMWENRLDGCLTSLFTVRYAQLYSSQQRNVPTVGRTMVFGTAPDAVNYMYITNHPMSSDLVMWQVECGNMQKETFLALYPEDYARFWNWRAQYNYPPDNKEIAQCPMPTLVTPRGTFSADWVELVEELERRSD